MNRQSWQAREGGMKVTPGSWCLVLFVVCGLTTTYRGERNGARQERSPDRAIAIDFNGRTIES